MKKKTILLIEDNPGDARLIRELLKEFCLECDVTHAKTLSAGLHALAESVFDVILLDLTLQDSTGEQTFQSVNDACRNTPIVIITGLADDELAMKLIKEGAQDFINKSNLTSLYLGKAIQYSVERSKFRRALADELETKKIHEEKIERLIRINRMLSNINQLIVRTKDIDTVFRESCNIAVRDGGFLMAFIALRDGNTNTVVINAHTGIDEHYLAHINIDLQDKVRSGGPLGKTLLTGKYHYSNDIENDLLLAPRKKDALKRGFRSAAVFPLNVREKTIGAMTVYSAETNFFSDDEIDVLSEMALDIAFAVKVSEDETVRKKAIEEIALNDRRLKSLVKVLQYEADSVKDFLDHALLEAISLTDSTIGYIYRYDEETKEFTLNTWSPEVMKECTVQEQQTVYQLEKTGFWGEAVRQRKAIMENNFPAPDPLKKGYPEGHVHLSKFLTIPIFEGSRIVAVVGVGNKKTDYDETDQMQLTLLMDTVWKVVLKREAEESLRQSEVRFKEVAENALEWFWESDEKGMYTYCSAAVKKILGYTPEELVGKKTFFDLFDTDYRKKHTDSIIEDFNRKESLHEFLNLNRHKNGSLVYLSTSAVPILNPDGSLKGYRGVDIDITERMQTLQQLEEWALRFGAVWENSIEAMRLTDSDGKIVKVNAAYCSLFKKSKEEIEGKSMSLVHHPDVRASVEKHYAERFRLRSVEEHYEGMVHLWNGEDIMVEGTHAFLEIPKQPTLLLSVFRNVTERMHMIGELAESEKKFRTVVEEAAEIIFTVNNDGIFTYANPAATRSTGYSVEGMKGKTIWDLVEPEYRRRVMFTFIRQRSHKISESTIEFPVTTKTGERKWFNNNARLMIENGTVNGFYVIARDVTELRIATEALLESERKYKNLFNHSPLGIYQSMPNGDLISANKAMADMLGYATPAELLKLNLARNIYYDPKERENLIREHEPHGSTDDTEIRWRKKNGDMIWVQMDARAIKDESGKTVMFEGFIRNITDRKKAESALIESEERFRSVTQSANEAIITTDRRTRIVHWNTGAMRIFGYKEQEILGKDLTTILPSASYAKHRMAVFESKRLNEPRIALKTVETYGRNKNKTEFPVEISVSSWSTSAGEFITEIIRDISDRKKSEELQLLFTTAFESAANGITITDAAGDIIWVNKSFTRMTGYSLEEVKGKNPRILKSGEQTAEHYKHLWDTILSGNVWKGEMVNRKKDGSTYIDEMTITPVRNEQHQISHFVAIKQDVTERNKILDQIEQQARLLAEANDAIIMRDMEHRILYWNKGAEKMYGWTQNEVFGKNACDLLGYDPALFQKEVDQLIATGEVTGEYRHAGKLKKEILAEVRLSVIRDQKGKPKAVMSINTDISEKKAIEKQILRTQRLDSLGTLAGGIAHDLNNVLSPILLSIEILKKMYPEEKSHKIITAVESSAKRGSDIVKQILLFARGIDAKNTVMQCRHLVNDLVSIFKETFPRSITIEHNIPKNVSTIMADPTHFHQLLMNLGVNARDAMPNGGTLTISAENRHIDEQYAKMNIQAKPGNYVMFTVADTGIGMSEEVLNRIFEPFFTTKQIGQGTGLGLATVHTIIKGLQGFIEVKSKPGDGTKFYVYIPAAESSAPVSESGKEKQHVNGNNELILLVEDEESVRTVTKQTLEMFQYRVVTATDGAEGLMVYAQHQQDVSLVITDMMMPIMDGNHLILALRKMKPDLKIIASSGLVDKPAIESYDIQAFLEKPYVAEKLLTTVKEVLTSKNTVQ